MLDVISGLAGAMLSLVFSYVPGASDWFGKLDGERKRLVMLGLLVLAAVVVMALACSGAAGDFGISATCDRAGVVALVRAFLAALVVNQAAYLISPGGKGRLGAEMGYEEPPK